MSDHKNSNDLFSKIPLWFEDKELEFGESANESISSLRIKNWEDFIKLLKIPFFKNKNEDLIFRGQRRSDWTLQPSIARHSENGLFSEELVEKQLTHFKKAIRGRIKDYSFILNNNDKSDNEIWAIGQHYGLSTPLLDWTYSPYVALFFAFSRKDNHDYENPNEYRAIYIANNNPPVKRAVFRLPCKGLGLHKPLKGHVKRPTTAQ